MTKRKKRYLIERLVPEVILPSGYVIPEHLSEVETDSRPAILVMPEEVAIPINTLWLKITDQQENKVLYEWRKDYGTTS